MQKEMFNKTRDSPSMRRFSTSATADSTRKSFFGGNLGASPGGSKKTALSNSRLSLSGRSTTQSIQGIRSECNAVEVFGQPLPVAVNEALTFAGPMGNSVSAKITQSGWAWVVQGRRLLIWQYKRQGKRGGASAQCRELTLPHSDIGHKSELVSVFQTEDTQAMASCIAVSATGDVRYWASIAHDNNSVDLSILTGQEFVQLLSLPTQQGYLAVTSTCTLVFLRVGLTKGRYSLHHKTIKPATSLLGGFGKRVASMLIGINSGSDKDQLLVGMCCESNNKNGETVVGVLSDRGLQRWCLSNKGNTELLIYEEVELFRKVREMLLLRFWNVRAPNDNVDLEVHFLDYHILQSYHYILVGAINHSVAPNMNYAIVVASASPERMVLECFSPLKKHMFFNNKTWQECLSLRIIVGTSHTYLYTPKVVYPLRMLKDFPTAEVEAEKVEFHLHEDRILSAAMCNRLPLFFSRTHGLVAITPESFDGASMIDQSNSPDMFSPFKSSFVLNDQSMLTDNSNCLPMYQLDPNEVYTESSTGVGQLKAAFLYRLKHDNEMMKTTIVDFVESIAECEHNGAPLDVYKIDRVVITIAEDLAEDLPIGDPRWQSAIEEYDGERHPLGSSHSMQIINQLRDKSSAFELFIDFLHFSGLWDKLNAIPCGSNVLKHTSYILADISEKIIAATALRGLQSKMPKLIDDAIDFTVSHWDEKPYDSLTTQDIFYVKLCKFQCIFMALADMADDRIASQDRTTAMVAQFISDINTIVLGTLSAVWKHREHNANSFKPPANSCENQPWTATSGSAGCNDSLIRLIDITVRYGAQCVTESELKHTLYQQILELMDIVLEGRKTYLDSVRGTEKFQVLQQQFETQRRELISVLIKDQQYECAVRLAEKYLDFQSLVLICDETQDNDRMDEYTRKYEEYDFSQFAINWHLRQKRHGEVFERFKGNQSALAHFMRDHPSLGWIQLIFNGNHERAAKVLFELAQGETEFVARKKSMLSLSKLSALAAADADLTMQVAKINSELAIIEYQSQLAHNVLQNFGFDATDQKVLKVEEIINLFIADENDSATEIEFRKALELLNFVDQPYDLRHKIWCAAIRRDNWTDYDANNAVDYIHNLLFYKIIELSQLMGNDADGTPPPMEDFLESAELSELAEQQTFQYLLKLTYEYVGDLFKQTEDMEL